MRRESLGGAAELDESLQTAALKPYFNKGADEVTGLSTVEVTSIPLDSLPGIIVDDSQAKLKGNWSRDGRLSPRVGAGYLWRIRGLRPKPDSNSRFRKLANTKSVWPGSATRIAAQGSRVRSNGPGLAPLRCS